MTILKGSRGHKESSKSSFFVKICLIGGLLCCLLGLVFWLSDVAGTYDAAGQKTGTTPATWIAGLNSKPSERKVIRKTQVEDTFATIFHSELMSIFSLHDWKPERASNLLDTLRKMERTGVKTVMFSVSWDYAAPDESTLRWNYLNSLADLACSNTTLKVSWIVDMLRSPSWLFRKFPDSRAMDSGNRNYSHMSWFHQPSNAVALDMLKRISQHMAQKYPGCVVAVQPVYNNEYEAKYTQEYDSYQDYNGYALEAYRDWLRSKKQEVPTLNRRWRTSFKNWGEVKPPGVLAGMQMGVEDGARYWDWMQFRVEYGAGVFNRACSTVKAAGLKCFHHFPEFFSVLDAIYGAAMFARIAASPHTDFLIMDSNFMTPYRTVMNPVKLRLYIAAALAYNKPIYFEAAVERYAALDLIRAGYKNSLLAGAPNFGITNWLSRVDMNSSLKEAFLAPSGCGEPSELVGVFIHLQSCSAWQGLQWHWKERDPLHNFIEDIAERLTQSCSSDIAVYIELDRFVADLPTFDRVVFVEPLVLYGAAELKSYVAAKAGLETIPHELLTLPTNSSRGLYLKVLQDL